MAQWHVDVSSLVLRQLPDGAAFGSPYTAIASVKFIGNKRAYMEGFLRVDGKSISVKDLRDLGRMLRDSYGVTHVLSIRRGREVVYHIRDSL